MVSLIGWDLEWWLIGPMGFVMLGLALLVIGSLATIVFGVNGGDPIEEKSEPQPEGETKCPFTK